MKNRKDILFELNKDSKHFDLSIKNGDFVIGDSNLQHVAHIIEAEQGQFRQHPLVGVGVIKMLNGPISGAEKRNIRLQLEADGYKAKEIVFREGLLKVRI